MPTRVGLGIIVGKITEIEESSFQGKEGSITKVGMLIKTTAEGDAVKAEMYGKAAEELMTLDCKGKMANFQLNIIAREWTNDAGDVKYFSDLRVSNIDWVGQKPQALVAAAIGADEDIPF